MRDCGVMRHGVVCIVGAFSLLLIAGCGGGTLSSFSAPSGPSSASINPLGGSVSSGTATLTVPANAVPAATVFTLGAASSYPANAQLVTGSAYTLSYTGVFVTQPMTLTIGYSSLPTGVAASSLTMYTVVGNNWQAVPNSTVNTSNGTVSANIQAPGTYGIF